ncbi:hypothetical protein ACSAZK_10290 [Methanosarcina sp. Mfa9]|uniref:hypothetical protein n=1 Tax=Methanosarcina sp. Mfa9 TaxID=3439063 RepID=UPI003F8533AC
MIKTDKNSCPSYRGSLASFLMKKRFEGRKPLSGKKISDSGLLFGIEKLEG